MFKNISSMTSRLGSEQGEASNIDGSINEADYKKLPDIVDIGADIDVEAYITPVLVFGTTYLEQRILMLFHQYSRPVQAGTYGIAMERAARNTAVRQEPETPVANDTLRASTQHQEKRRSTLKRKRADSDDSDLAATDSSCTGHREESDGAIDAPKPPVTPEVEEPPTRKCMRAASWSSESLLCQQKINKGQHIWAQLHKSQVPVKEATIRDMHGNDKATTVPVRHMIKHQSCASHFEHAKATLDQRKDKYGYWLMGFDASCPDCIPPLLERTGGGGPKDPFHYQVSRWAMENEHWANPGGWADSRNPPPIPVGAMKKKKGRLNTHTRTSPTYLNV
ncbi:hypothetical protein COCOBI_13-3260 [Coccomyxa sp. Obi]|nr:hypothetical protein COCOBI_13-3260 [Coccomyxa sp. Obi]